MPILSSSKLVQPRLFTNEADRISSAEMPAAVAGKKMKEKYIPMHKQQQRLRRKKISFSESVRVRSFLHIDEYTDEEFFNTWYSQREMTNMKKNMSRDLKRWLVAQQSEKKKLQKQRRRFSGSSKIPFSSKQQEESSKKKKKELLTDHYMSNDNNDELFTIRGLEYRTKKGSEIRRRNKYSAISAVLNEHEIQVACGSKDSAAIRSLYLQHGSKRCALEAQKMGARDALVAQGIYNEDQEKKIEAEKNSKMEEKESLFNHLYIQTFHRKRQVIEELKSLVSQLEKQQD